MKELLGLLSEILAKGIMLGVVLLLGDFLGDQKTLKDCATKGTHVIFGGGAITCTVVKG